MEITYSLKSFKNLLECLKANSDEFVVNVDENGINIIVVNHGNTTIFRTEIPKTAFKCFDIKEDIKFGLDVGILKTVKKLKGDFISITNVTDEKISFNCGDINFTERNIENARVPRNPAFELNYEYSINSTELFRIIDIINTKSDCSVFSSNAISGEGIDVNIENKINIVNSKIATPSSKIDNNLLLYYKTCFPRCVKTATVKIDKDFPISISGRGENDEYYEIMISPRIDD